MGDVQSAVVPNQQDRSHLFDSYIAAKLLSAFSIAVVAFLFGILPLFLARSSHFHSLANYAILFSGGVFLQVAISHMIFEAFEALETLQYGSLVASLCISVGFCFAYYLHSHSHKHPSLGPIHGGALTPLGKASIADADSIVVSEKTRGIVMVGMLAMHSVASGVALGLLQDSYSIYNLTIGIIIHKAPESFSLGMSLSALEHSSPRWCLALLASFALGTPIGSMFGLALDLALHNERTGDILSAVMVALSGGTFLFIAFVDTLWEHLFKGSPRKRWASGLSAFAVGYFVMHLASAPHVHHDHIREMEVGAVVPI
eukprot:ANDGO_00759.mRNA.1 Protein zntC